MRQALGWAWIGHVTPTGYLAQPHSAQPHTSQVQTSPSQSGHWQFTQQPQPPVVVPDCPAKANNPPTAANRPAKIEPRNIRRMIEFLSGMIL
jgi:hypothetical protein